MKIWRCWKCHIVLRTLPRRLIQSIRSITLPPWIDTSDPELRSHGTMAHQVQSLAEIMLVANNHCLDAYTRIERDGTYPPIPRNFHTRGTTRELCPDLVEWPRMSSTFGEYAYIAIGMNIHTIIILFPQISQGRISTFLAAWYSFE